MTKHIHLLSNARSGSTYMYHVLRKYISPMQDSEKYNEPFSTKDLVDQNVLVDNIDAIEQSEQRLIIKNHNSQLNTLQTNHNDLYARFRELDLYTVVLIRKNLFESALSFVIAEQTGEWVKAQEQDKKLTLDPKRVSALVSSRAISTSQTVANVHNFKYDEIVYYEDLKGWARHDYSLLKLSGETDISMLRPVAIDEVTRSPDKRLMVENYDQLYHAAEITLKQMNNRDLLPNLRIRGCQVTHMNF